MPAISGGRGTAISGSRPTMIVSVWCACMAPAPDGRLAQHHEAGDVIDDVVHPGRLEGGAVAAFVPARIAAPSRRARHRRGRTARTRHEPQKYQPPRPRECHGAEPDRRVAHARDRRSASSAPSCPCGRPGTDTIARSRGRALDGALVLGSDQRIVARLIGCVHQAVLLAVSAGLFAHCRLIR